MPRIPEPEGPDIVEFATSEKYLDCERKGGLKLSAHQRAILKALYGVKMTTEETTAFRQMSEGRDPRPSGYRKMAAVCGVRGGKSCLAAIIATYECVRWGPELEGMLIPGQVATGIIIAADKKQAGIVRGYIEGNFRTLESNGYECFARTTGQARAVTETLIRLIWPIEIAIYPANKASVRGATGLFFIGDEIAWWKSEEGAYNQDTEVIRAVRSRFATLSRLGPKELMISSPNMETGVLWEAYRKRRESKTLVVQAASQMLNPAIEQTFLDEELEEDSEAYARDYLAQFQKAGGGSVFLPANVVDPCIERKRLDSPAQAGKSYYGAIDAAFKRDRFAFGIAHRDGEAVPIDLIRAWTPKKGMPIDPDEVVDDISGYCRMYAVDKLYGDQFADVPLKKAFEKRGVMFVERPQTATNSYEMWKNLRAVLRARLTRLPDDPLMRKDLVGLISTRTRLAKTVHVGAPNLRSSYDDIAKVIALLVQELLPLGGEVDIAKLNEGAMNESGRAQHESYLDWKDPEGVMGDEVDPFQSVLDMVM